jgi:hypothetical protein
MCKYFAKGDFEDLFPQTIYNDKNIYSVGVTIYVAAHENNIVSTTPSFW